MKELYISPKAEIIEFDVKDVITTSGLGNGEAGAAVYENQDGIWIEKEY